MAFTVTLLGTGTSQGVPMIACTCANCLSADTRDKRLRSSILMQGAGGNIVIDTGPDFRQQMLRCGLKRLDAVVFTHEHKDHVAGLDDVRAFNYFADSPMEVFATPRVQVALKREFAYAFEENSYPGVPRIALREIGQEPFSVAGFSLTPVQVSHLNMPVTAFRCGGFAYVTDANYISESEKEKLTGLDTLVLNALRKEPHVSHFSLRQAIEMGRELGAKKTYFTHISHQMGKHEEVSRELPEGFYLGYDGLELEIG